MSRDHGDESPLTITPHFSSAEFACRDADRTPYPASWIDERLTPLCEQLEILRAALGNRAVTVLSGYRTLAWNRHVGGARASQHMQGRAADIRVSGIAPHRVHERALQLYKDGTLEIGGLGEYATFTHLDIRPGHRLARWSGTRTTT